MKKNLPITIITILPVVIVSLLIFRFEKKTTYLTDTSLNNNISDTANILSAFGTAFYQVGSHARQDNIIPSLILENKPSYSLKADTSKQQNQNDAFTLVLLKYR